MISVVAFGLVGPRPSCRRRRRIWDTDTGSSMLMRLPDFKPSAAVEGLVGG